MSVFFLDASALAKRYLTETGSQWIDSLLDPAAGHLIAAADSDLLTAAQSEGLATDNPNLYP